MLTEGQERGEEEKEIYVAMDEKMKEKKESVEPSILVSLSLSATLSIFLSLYFLLPPLLYLSIYLSIYPYIYLSSSFFCLTPPPLPSPYCSSVFFSYTIQACSSAENITECMSFRRERKRRNLRMHQRIYGLSDIDKHSTNPDPGFDAYFEPHIWGQDQGQGLG